MSSVKSSKKEPAIDSPCQMTYKDKAERISVDQAQGWAMIDLGPPPPWEDIGRRLELTRLALGYKSQTAFVQRLSSTGFKITAQTWNNWERGRHRISVDGTDALRAVFGIPSDWVFGGVRDALPLKIAENIEQLLAHQRVWPFRARA